VRSAPMQGQQGRHHHLHLQDKAADNLLTESIIEQNDECDLHALTAPFPTRRRRDV
jgi:hypothetical protein